MSHDHVDEDTSGLPEFANLELSDVIDVTALQEMMDDYYAITGIGVGILDLKGKVLVGIGWQDICVKFHRRVPESCIFCLESDISLSTGVPPGTFMEYRCKNNMWDIVTPIMFGDRHIGNIFLGQFLYDDEEPDYDLFCAQARRFGYDEAEYLAALDRVPRWSRETVRAAMGFYSKMAQMISKANYNNVILADTLARREQAEEALRVIFNSAHDAIFIHELNGDIIDVNDKMLEMYEVDRHAALTLSITGHYSGPDNPFHKVPTIWEKVVAGENQLFEWQARRIRDGSLFDVEVSLHRISLNQRHVILATVRDITARKQAEKAIEQLNRNIAARAVELEAANRELEAFNYTVSHDLRAPLTSISTCNQIIQVRCGDILDEECQGVIRIIDEQILRMDQIITTLLDFSNLMNCKVSREKVDLSRLAKVIAAQLQLDYPQRPVTFVIADGVEALGSEGLLTTVLENLIGNAWKYTGNQESALIEFGVTEMNGTTAYFIRDNGPGFDMADANRLLRPFQRLPGADGFQGFGIGLATVERIVSRHGGKVWAYGEPGKGATFYFTLSND